MSPSSMIERWSTLPGLLRSWVADNCNRRTAAISVAAAVSGLALVYVWKAGLFRMHAYQEVIDFGRRYDRRMTRRKRQLLSGLDAVKSSRGDGRIVILEIGCGGGFNLQYYPDGSEVICVDPDPNFAAALDESARSRPEVKITAFLVSSAENMREVDSGSVDAVVSTTVLCVVGDVDRCLREIQRVLKPGGKFFFIEHVRASQHNHIRLIQTLLDYPLSLIQNGCHIARTTQNNIRSADFSRVDLEEFDAFELTTPTKISWDSPLVRPHIIGTATK